MNLRSWRGHHLFKGVLAIFILSLIKECFVLREIANEAATEGDPREIGLRTTVTDYRHLNTRRDKKSYQDLESSTHGSSTYGSYSNITVLPGAAPSIRTVKHKKPIPIYHKIYPVNCAAIFHGDVDEIKATDILLNKSRNANGSIPLPSRKTVHRWVTDCPSYRKGRGYPDIPLSFEEAEYPIAYSLVVYRGAAQVERLLRAIYQPQNVYCIHVDKKSSDAYYQTIKALTTCFDNVFITSKRIDVKWGSLSSLTPDLYCMRDLLKHPVKWKYFLNVCGKDFPLKTNLEIVHQLKAYNDRNCIEGYIYKRHEIRTKYIRGTKKLKPPPPYNITVYKGDTYIAATRAFIKFLSKSKVAKSFLYWLRDTYVPDEYFTSSLNRLPYAPGGYTKPTMECNVRYRKWKHNLKFKSRPTCIGKNIRDLCIFGTGYLKYLHRTRQLFVNKFGYDFDPIAIQCMEEELNYRTLHPEIAAKWKYFPVRTYSWQRENHKKFHNISEKNMVKGLPVKVIV